MKQGRKIGSCLRPHTLGLPVFYWDDITIVCVVGSMRAVVVGMQGVLWPHHDPRLTANTYKRGEKRENKGV